MPPGPLTKALRLYHTLRHLRPEQLAGQLRHRLRQRFTDPAAHPAATPPRDPCQKLTPTRPPQLAQSPNPQGTPNDPDALRTGRYTFINQTHALGFPPEDWQAADTPKLWQYNLHYHEWLHDLPFAEAREAALHWIDHHPLVKDAVGREAYPTSLRLQNWCALFFGRHRAETLADRDFADALWRSIVQQATWLRDRLEWHLMGNHLLENAFALSMVGAASS
jgi:hypothetical protein